MREKTTQSKSKYYFFAPIDGDIKNATEIANQTCVIIEHYDYYAAKQEYLKAYPEYNLRYLQYAEESLETFIFPYVSSRWKTLLLNSNIVFSCEPETLKKPVPSIQQNSMDFETPKPRVSKPVIKPDIKKPETKKPEIKPEIIEIKTSSGFKIKRG